MKNALYLLTTIAFLLSSCNQIDQNDLEGKWVFDGIIENPDIPYEFIFKLDSVAFTDDQGFKQIADYQLVDNDLLINVASNSSLRIKIDAIIEDTLFFSKEDRYFRQEPHEDEFNSKVFQMIGIKTHQLLEKEANLSKVYYYKSPDGNRVIRAGEAFITFDDLPLFLIKSHQRPAYMFKKTVVFIGEGINLTDLKRLYYTLWQSGQYQTILIVNKRNYADYDIFADRIDIWWNDYENFFKKKGLPLPPPPPFLLDNKTSRQAFLGNNGEVIEVNSIADFPRLISLKKGIPYVILINNTMSMADYIELKLRVYKIARLREIDIYTEIE